MKIYFIHEGKAAYPEIAAYRAFFASRFETQEIHPDAVSQAPALAQSICWYMMGYYPERPAKAALIIHDYRSLSVGKNAWLKDLMKRWRNAVPDIRIFQNKEMLAKMRFTTEVPTLFLPMGVPEFVLASRALPQEPVMGDFCYIGVMSRERRSERMIDSFLRRFPQGRTLHLFGEPEAEIRQRYQNQPSIIFHGAQPQDQVFAVLRKMRVAVNYFPDHPPHVWQTPTKLLEYAALGLRILCNEHPQSRQVAQRYGLVAQWGASRDMFANVPEDLSWPDNATFDPSPLLWPQIIAQSGIAQEIERMLTISK